MDLGFVFVSTLVSILSFGGLIAAVMYLDRISKDMRQIKTLIAAFMEQRVAGTVAENRLAAAVQEASKDKSDKW